MRHPRIHLFLLALGLSAVTTFAADDSKQVYLAVAGEYFAQKPEVMADFAERYGARDDLAVTLFLATRARRPVEEVHQLRMRGLFWWEIAFMNDVPGDVWFPEYEGEPGPPYGRAYEKLSGWRHGSIDKLDVSDDEVRHLVAVRMLHEYFRIPIEQAMDLRKSGRDLPTILESEVRKRSRGDAVPHDRSAGNGSPTSGR